MTTNIRRGKVPHSQTGVSPYLDEIYTIKGFFGDWAMLYRTHNVGHPKEWSNEDLMNLGADTNLLRPTDLDDPRGAPMALMTGDGIVISLSRRSAAMPFAEKNADHHQIRFYHRGEFTLETELGALEVKAGDFVVIPVGVMYRETAKNGDKQVMIFESRAPIRPAEELWDTVGFTSFFADFTLMVLPEPVPQRDAAEIEVETEVRVKFRGKYERLVFSFDPLKDVVGWMGDPVIYKLKVWDIPGMGTSHGFLPPPSGAVLIGENKEFFFNVMSPKPMPTSPAPNGSYGAPAHLNDYEEFWFNHRSDRAPTTEGHIWRLPAMVVHPGLKRPPMYPENPVKQIEEIKLNFDTKVALSWTDEARAAFLPDPHTAVHTSLYGAHIGVVPAEAMKHVKK